MQKKQRFDMFFKMEKLHEENQRLAAFQSESESLDEAAVAASNISMLVEQNSNASRSPHPVPIDEVNEEEFYNQYGW